MVEVLRSNLQVFLDLEKSYAKRGFEATWCDNDTVIANALQSAVFGHLLQIP